MKSSLISGRFFPHDKIVLSKLQISNFSTKKENIFDEYTKQ